MSQVDTKDISEVPVIKTKVDLEPKLQIVGFLDLGPGPELNWLELDRLFQKNPERELGSSNAYLKIQDMPSGEETLSSLYEKTQHIPTKEMRTEIDRKTQFAGMLGNILETHGFRQVKGFSGIREILVAGKKYPQFGAMIIVPLRGSWIELPSGIYDLSAAKKIQAGEMPTGAKNIKDLQKQSHVLQFDRDIIYERSGFGLGYMKTTGFSRHFECLYDGTPGQRKDWVILKTPEAVQDYIQQRFNGNLDLKTGNLSVANDKKGAIVGKTDELGERHIEKLEAILHKKIHFR